MARTKASVGAKVSSGKSSKARCSVAAPSTSNGTGSGRSGQAAKSAGGGNPVCPRDTPKWQRPITNFFNGPAGSTVRSRDSDADESREAEQPKPRTSKRNVIESDDEEEEKRPTDEDLDETTELEPLTGDSSHKLEEYYPPCPKGKGVGKKTANKENVDCNSRRDSAKRDLEDEAGEEVRASKRARVSDS